MILGSDRCPGPGDGAGVRFPGRDQLGHRAETGPRRHHDTVEIEGETHDGGEARMSWDGLVAKRRGDEVAGGVEEVMRVAGPRPEIVRGNRSTAAGFVFDGYGHGQMFSV